MAGMDGVRSKAALRAAGFAALGWVTLAVCTGSALAQNVVVQGNRRIEAETIRSYLSLAPGESFTPARINQAIKDLYATGLFSNVKISRQGGAVVVAVVENSIINRVTFQGNSKVKTETLTGEVQSRSRGPFSQAQVDQDVARIRDVYRRSGRNEAQVEARVTDAPNGRVDVAFVVNEGVKTGVSSIEFVGNSAYSGGKLRGVMTTTESGLLSFLKSTDVYDPDRLAADLELIRRFYLKNGYADFRVVSTDVQYDASRRGYVITIAVDEGNRYRVADVDVESRIPDVDADTLRRSVRTRSGDVYNAEAVEKTVEDVSSVVARRGYAFAQVRPRGDRNPTDNTVRIVYTVEEGPRVYIERINVRGNTRTRDYVIRREFDVGEGDAYNKGLIDQAERRLRNLGYFKNVRITNEPGSSPDRVVVNVDVEDQSTGAFQIAGGYSTADGFIGEVSVTETNLLGRGQYVRVAGSTGQRSSGFDFSFTEPFFLDRRLAVGFDLFNKNSDNTNFARYENILTGGTLRATVPFTDEFSIGVRYSLFQQDFKIPNTSSKPYNDCTVEISGVTYSPSDTGRTNNLCIANGEASIAVKEAVGTTLTSMAGLTFVYNTLDNTRNPTSGLYAELRTDVAGLGGDSHFARANGDIRYYYPVTDDITAVFRGQAGTIAAIGGDNLRLADHFFMGPNLVRGFASNGIGPRDVNGDSQSNAVGGTHFAGISAELQFPIFGLPRELGLRGAVFADAGTLFGYRGARAFDINRNGVFDCTVTATLPQGECLNVRDEKSIRSSVGASLLWSSPLGPIRFDYAIALSKDDGVVTSTSNGAKVGGDRTQAFRFSGGARF